MKSGKVVVRNWDEFFSLANAFIYGGWIFRGQKDARWQLTTGIERLKHDRELFLTQQNNVQGASWRKSFKNYLGICAETPNEIAAIDEFRKFANREGIDCGESRIDYLAVMQHYGSRTRLLDFTESLLVALYFAFEETYFGSNRAIWALRIKSIEEYANCKLRKDEHFSECRDNEMKANVLLSNATLLQSVSLPEMVIPIRLQANNDRLVAQNGMFLFPFHGSAFEQNAAPSLGVLMSDMTCSNEIQIEDVAQGVSEEGQLCLLKIECDASMSRDSRCMLNMANISERTMFHGLEGVAKSIGYTFM